MKNQLRPYCLAACVLATLFHLPAAGRAETITWATPTANGNWNDPANWIPPVVPTVYDTVEISGVPFVFAPVVLIDDAEGAYDLLVQWAYLVVTNGGSLEVTNVTAAFADIEVEGGTMEAETMTIANSGISVAAGMLQAFNVTLPAGDMEVTGGTLVTGSVTVDALGSLSQNGGQLINVEGITNESMGTVSITGDFSLTSVLLNYGTLNLEDGSILLWYDGSEFNGQLDNEGTIDLSGASGDEIVNFYGTEFFDNFGGTVTVEANTGPCLLECASQAFQGSFNAPAGTVLQFQAGDPGITVSGAALLNGPGQFEWVSGRLYLGLPIPNLLLIGGSVGFDPNFQQEGGTNDFVLEGSTLYGALSDPYLVSETFAVTNSILAAAIDVLNGGVLNLTSAALATNGSLTVEPGGVVNIMDGFSVDGALTNAGTINLYSGLTFAGGRFASMTNAGTVNVASGAGVVSIDTDGGFLAGAYSAAAGTTVQFTGGTASAPLVVTQPPILNGPGGYEFSGYVVLPDGGITNLVLSGGTVTLPPGQQNGMIANLALEGGTLAGNYQINGTLAVTNVLLTGALAVNAGGALNSTGATLAATASVTVEPGASLGINSTNFGLTGGMVAYGPITNLGEMNLTNATLTLSDNGSSSASGGIVNQGTINFYGELGDRVISAGVFEYLLNQGTVNLEPGTGKSSISANAGLLSGAYNAAGGTTMQLAGGSPASPLTVQRPLFLNGLGTYQFTFGCLRLEEATIPNLALVGGTLELGPEFQDNGAITNLDLSGMTLAGPCDITGVLFATNTSFSGAVAVNSGAILDAAGVTFAPAAPLTVAAGAEFNGSGSLSIYSPLTNLGTISLSNAALALFNNGTTSSGAIDNEGQIDFHGASGVQIASHLGRESFLNAGAIALQPGVGNSAFDVPLFDDPGTIDVEDGVLTLNDLPLEPSSTLRFGLNSASDYGKIAVQTNVALAGTVICGFNNNFAPASGGNFGVLSAASLAGTFASVMVPANSDGETAYGSNLFSFSFAGITPPPQPVLTITRSSIGAVTVSWPSAGNFTLQTSASMAPGAWTGVTSGIITAGQDSTYSTTISAAPAFFRLKSQ
jgi:autotransporter family porin